LNVQLTIQELAAFTGGQFVSQADGVRCVTGAAAVSDAGEGDVTFFGNAKYLAALKSSKATVALVPLDFEEPIGPVALRVANPSLAFAQVMERFAPEPVVFTPGVHPTALVAPGVELGDGVSVQPYAVIEAGAKIGDRTLIGAHGYVGHDARIGSDCGPRHRGGTVPGRRPRDPSQRRGFGERRLWVRARGRQARENPADRDCSSR
jgi:UDP-3-O-[3-hydroxymyristoyl] glucosamine N-acyltransferase